MQRKQFPRSYNDDDDEMEGIVVRGQSDIKEIDKST
jgi:hypothetical protein